MPPSTSCLDLTKKVYCPKLDYKSISANQTVTESTATVMNIAGAMAALIEPDFPLFLPSSPCLLACASLWSFSDDDGGGAGGGSGCGPLGPYSRRQSPTTVLWFLCCTSLPSNPCSAAFRGIGSSKCVEMGPAGAAGPAGAGAGAARSCACFSATAPP